MQYPYEKFLKRFARKHSKQAHDNKPENKKAAVFVDGREHWAIPSVLKNFSYFLGPDWNFYVFHTERNRDYVERTTKKWDIQTFVIDKPRFTPETFTKLTTNPAFWQNFQEDYLLIFQTDCIACQPFDPKWLQYDYIGAPCGQNNETFNGGLSLRNRKTFQRALHSYHSFLDGQPEDVFFTKALRHMGANLPDGYEAGHFSVESFYYNLPFGVHGTDKGYHSSYCAEKIVKQIQF